MNLFDQLVTQALQNQPHLANLRTVVEKELLHHEILKVLSHNHLLTNLTFIGGTCLRCCYNSDRLSEDLDFTGGGDFTRDSLSTMGQVLIENLNRKYGFSVQASEPMKDKNNVDTWKVSVETRPGRADLPAQRIHIDICAVPSYEKQPMLLLNRYGVDMGTSGLIIQAQSREEIYADKLLAFAFRPDRIKYRDLWDIVWLHQHGITPRFALIPHKLRDRNHTLEDFLNLFEKRKLALNLLQQEFTTEMQRFLPAEIFNRTPAEQNGLWSFIHGLMDDLFYQLHQNI